MKISAFAACLAILGGALASEAAEPLKLAGRTALPAYSGDFDHFAADVQGRRLFLAGEDAGTLEVFDLATGIHLKTIKGFEAPHAIHFMPRSNRLIVTDSGTRMSKIVDGKSYRIVRAIKLTPGADVMAHDRSRNRLWIVTGGKNAEPKLSYTILYEVDPASGKRLGEVRFDTDFTEAIAFEERGRRMFVNLTGRSEVAVLDKNTRTVIATWPIKGGEHNAPIALDEANKRLFVVTREPFRLVVLDTDTGASIASLEAPQRTNELVFDEVNRRLYMAGDDYVGVVEQKDADHYEEIARVPSATGAKTAILLPELSRLYVAVSPGEGKTGGALLIYDVVPALPAAARFHRLEAEVKLKTAAPDWDYLSFEPARGYLFIGARHDGVIVYDVNARKVVRKIRDSEGANATTLVAEFDRGYTANDDGTATVFRLSTLETIGKIKLGEDADAGFYDPVSKKIAFMRGDSKEITYVDAKSGAVVARLPMQSRKLEASAADGEGNMFTAQRDRNAVVKVDLRVHQVVAEWPIDGCVEANGLAFDSSNQRLFIGCRGKDPVLAVLDSRTGRLVTRLEIGRGNDGVIYDAETRKVYASGGVDANLVVYQQLDADTYKLVEATTTRPYARTMALDPRTKKLYLVTAEGTVDPTKKVNKGPAPFYPNRYFADTFTLLIYAPK